MGWVWLAVQREVNTLMLASLCPLLFGACLLPCPAVQGAGTAHGCGLGEGWQWSSSSSAIPGTGAGQRAAESGVFLGAGVSWMGSILLFVSCPNTTGSPACPGITGGVQAGGSGTKFPVSSPISSSWKLQTQLGTKRPESCGVLGIRTGHTMLSLGQAPSCPGNRD